MSGWVEPAEQRMDLTDEVVARFWSKRRATRLTARKRRARARAAL